jgi:hypothetical protein
MESLTERMMAPTAEIHKKSTVLTVRKALAVLTERDLYAHALSCFYFIFASLEEQVDKLLADAKPGPLAAPLSIRALRARRDVRALKQPGRCRSSVIVLPSSLESIARVERSSSVSAPCHRPKRAIVVWRQVHEQKRCCATKRTQSWSSQDALGT